MARRMLRAHVCRRTVDVERVAPGVREGVVRGDRRTNIIPNSRSRGELVLPHAIRCPACQSLRSFDAHDLSFRARPSLYRRAALARRPVARPSRRPAGKHSVRYDAHIRLRTREGRVTDILLGAETRVSAGFALLDWRTAPLAEVFFGFEVGEEYVIDVAGRTLEGVVLERSLVTFERGALVEIAAPHVTLSQRGADGWTAVVTPPPSILESNRGDRLRPSSPEDLRLDAAQRRIVDLGPGRAVLILGEAGAGKTIVALRRVARLHTTGRRARRSLVIVPTEGLRALAA